MIIQGTSIPNLMIEVAGIMICIFALILIRFGMTQQGTNRRIRVFDTSNFNKFIETA